MLRSRILTLFLAVTAAILIISQTKLSRAENFDVSTTAQLRGALLVSQTNGETDFINIAPGTYNTGGVPFVYTAGPLENFGLNIIGSGRISTELNGGTQTAVLIIDTTAVLDDFNVNINIEELSVTEGGTSEFSIFAGGLTLISDGGNVMIDNCNFISNEGGSAGGARIFTFGQVSISECGFSTNESITSDGGGALIQGNFILLTDNTFTLNETASPMARGGGLSALAVANEIDDLANGTIILNGNVFFDNASEGHAGASLTADFGAELQGNSFENNTAGVAGAGGLSIDIVNDDPGDEDQNTLLTQLFSNYFSSNTTEGNGGGAVVSAGVDIIAVNNIFLQNSAASGGGTLLVAPDIIVTNNTFTLNNANGELFSGEGGGMRLILTDDNTADIYNNIVFDNLATGFGDDIYVEDDMNMDQTGSTVNLMFNDFSDFFSQCENDPPCQPNVNTMGNIDRDPRFVDAENGDVNLKRNSPARRAGDDMAPELPSSDFAGNPVNDPPDMGALQFVGGGGGGGSGSCSLAEASAGQSGILNIAFLLALPIIFILAGRFRRKTA